MLTIDDFTSKITLTKPKMEPGPSKQARQDTLYYPGYEENGHYKSSFMPSATSLQAPPGEEERHHKIPSRGGGGGGHEQRQTTINNPFEELSPRVPPHYSISYAGPHITQTTSEAPRAYSYPTHTSSSSSSSGATRGAGGGGVIYTEQQLHPFPYGTSIKQEPASTGGHFLTAGGSSAQYQYPGLDGTVIKEEFRGPSANSLCLENYPAANMGMAHKYGGSSSPAYCMNNYSSGSNMGMTPQYRHPNTPSPLTKYPADHTTRIKQEFMVLSRPPSSDLAQGSTLGTRLDYGGNPGTPNSLNVYSTTAEERTNHSFTAASAAAASPITKYPSNSPHTQSPLNKYPTDLQVSQEQRLQNSAQSPLNKYPPELGVGGAGVSGNEPDFVTPGSIPSPMNKYPPSSPLFPGGGGLKQEYHTPGGTPSPLGKLSADSRPASLQPPALIEFNPSDFPNITPSPSGEKFPPDFGIGQGYVKSNSQSPLTPSLTPSLPPSSLVVKQEYGAPSTPSPMAVLSVSSVSEVLPDNGVERGGAAHHNPYSPGGYWSPTPLPPHRSPLHPPPPQYSAAASSGSMPGYYSDAAVRQQGAPEAPCGSQLLPGMGGSQGYGVAPPAAFSLQQHQQLQRHPFPGVPQHQLSTLHNPQQERLPPMPFAMEQQYQNSYRQQQQQQQQQLQLQEQQWVAGGPYPTGHPGILPPHSMGMGIKCEPNQAGYGDGGSQYTYADYRTVPKHVSDWQYAVRQQKAMHYYSQSMQGNFPGGSGHQGAPPMRGEGFVYDFHHNPARMYQTPKGSNKNRELEEEDLNLPPPVKQYVSCTSSQERLADRITGDDLTLAQKFLLIELKLSDILSQLRFCEPVTHIYNPVDYAFTPHSDYVHRYCNGKKKVMFLGMNPGPFGMAQTGVSSV